MRKTSIIQLKIQKQAIPFRTPGGHGRSLASIRIGTSQQLMPYLKGKMDAIADKPTEADIEEKTQALFTSNSVNFWQNLPDVPFNLLMMMQSTTQLRILTQVSSSLKKRIKENILERPAKKKILRARIERALGPGIFPSNEEITNAMWLSKFELS